MGRCSDVPVMSSLKVLGGFEKGLLAKLAKLKIDSIESLLFHLPHRYQDRSHLCPIGEMRARQEVFFQGAVMSCRQLYRPRRMLVVSVADETGHLNMRFFHFSPMHTRMFREGAVVRGYGEVRRSQNSSVLEIIHPEWEFVSKASGGEPGDSFVPIYPLTAGLYQYEIRRVMKKAFRWLSDSEGLEELLPASLVKEAGDISLEQALRYIHLPPEDADIAELLDGKSLAHKRLVYEELLAFSVSTKSSRARLRQRKARAFVGDGELAGRFERTLDFDLTGAQHRVIGEVVEDLGKPCPMMRLVQGDVGSGKTLVAVMSMLRVVSQGFQAAMMVPTEILARQHGDNLKKMLQPVGVEVCVLFGQQGAKEKKSVLKEIRSAKAKIVVGTHALFQSDVVFDDLALIVVDEQHRFGVHQRFALREKGQSGDHVPHQLIMTATPIPRSLAMAFFADLDYSVVDEMPEGRIPVKTASVSESRRDEVIDRVHKACLAGQQAFWVCPLIEESETLDYQTVNRTFETLSEKMEGVKIALIHGRTQTGEREETMASFRAGEIQLLVATTVVEVGVDIPGATLMVIENADHFGLSQLHQLRGRIGRNHLPGYCVLLYSSSVSARAQRRLQVIKENHDGFVIAQEDLKLRGPGELLGTRQTGDMRFRIADFTWDSAMLAKIPDSAEQILKSHPEVCARLVARWLGDAQEYAGV